MTLSSPFQPLSDASRQGGGDKFMFQIKMSAPWATLRGKVARPSTANGIATGTMYGVPVAAGAAIFSGWWGNRHECAVLGGAAIEQLELLFLCSTFRKCN